MKGPQREQVRTTILIVGRRRPWKKQFQLTGQRWRFGLLGAAVLVPLLLTAVTYRMWSDWQAQAIAANPGSDYKTLARQVAAISTSTQAGLVVLSGQLDALASNAARLSELRNRLVGTVGLAPVIFRTHAVQAPQSAKGGVSGHSPGPGLMTSLRQLAAQLRQQTHGGGPRSL